MNSFDVAVIGGGSAGYAAARTAHEAGAKVAIIDQGQIAENDSMSNVLSKLKVEIFILNIENPVEQSPTIKGYKSQLNKPKEIEVHVKQGQSLNDVFIQLKELGIQVLSMRNKTNRLEELFIDMTKSNQNENTNE
mgnify:CR=1 FL=1